MINITLGMSYEDAHEEGWRGTDEGSQLAGNADLWHNGQLVDNPAFGSSGFDALPGGYRYTNGPFSNKGYSAYFWSSTEYSTDYAWKRGLYYSNSAVYRGGNGKHYGFSVRCVRD